MLLATMNAFKDLNDVFYAWIVILNACVTQGALQSSPIAGTSFCRVLVFLHVPHQPIFQVRTPQIFFSFTMIMDS